MIDLLGSLHLTLWQWLLAGLCGLLIGASKTGLTGMGFLAFPILAGIFGARVSTGVALPMLLLADFFAVGHYNRHADWKHLLRLMPWAMVGLFIALAVGGRVSNQSFGLLFAATILAGIALLFLRDLRRKSLSVPHQAWFPGIMGMSAGFATMIGNAAGPMMSLYLLSMRLPKQVFIGTGAWFYLTVNVVKMPLQAFVWHTISRQTLAFNLVTAPFIVLGIVGGIATVRHIPEKAYRLLVMASVTLAALLLVIKLIL
jgi:uncharacterized membrane protein YfcA